MTSRQWRRGTFQGSADYYAASLTNGDVQLAFVETALVGTFRLLLREPIVWPEIVDDEAVYISNLAVKRIWAHRDVGRRLLAWAEECAATRGRTLMRLDCLTDSLFLHQYYYQAGFHERGDIDARFPDPVGTLRLRRYEKRVYPQSSAAPRPR